MRKNLEQFIESSIRSDESQAFGSPLADHSILIGARIIEYDLIRAIGLDAVTYKNSQKV